MNIIRTFTKSCIWELAELFTRDRPIRTASRLLAKCCPLQHDVIYERYLDKYSILIDNARFIETQVIHAGYESWFGELLERSLPKSAFVSMDIGANVGLTALMMAKDAPKDSLILAIEPSPAFFSRLQRNLRLNPQAAAIIRPINCGLGQETGTMFWIEDPDQPGNGLLNSSSGQPVPVTTVAGLLAEHPIDRLDFVKIDVEGMEHEVLKGGWATWRRFRPIIMFETLPATPRQKGYDVFQVIADEFGAMEYDLFSISLNNEIKPALPTELTHNSLLVPREVAGRFR